MNLRKETPRATMPERMIGIRVTITRCVDDSGYPPVVECESRDAEGQIHHFVEKSAIVTADVVDSRTIYPYPAVVACRVVGRSTADSPTDAFLVDTELPWHVSSTDEKTQFNVHLRDLVEFEFGEYGERPWNGIA
jgi:hypothetical protein